VYEARERTSRRGQRGACQEGGRTRRGIFGDAVLIEEEDQGQTGEGREDAPEKEVGNEEGGASQTGDGQKDNGEAEQSEASEGEGLRYKEAQSAPGVSLDRFDNT
jgi:hypothetical protein